jgi:enoyl-CoA hydratase/carnithine racemase
MDIAGRIAEKPRSSLALLKAHLVSGRRRIYEGALSAEAEMHRESFAGPDVVPRILQS